MPDNRQTSIDHRLTAWKYLDLTLEMGQTHEAKTAILQAYSGILSMIITTDVTATERWSMAEALWYSIAPAIVQVPQSMFESLLLELEADREKFVQIRPGNLVIYRRLRIPRVVALLFKMLEENYGGRHHDFINRLCDEQPRYNDRPSNFEEILRRYNENGHEFSEASNMLNANIRNVGILRDIIEAFSLMIAYTCSLFKETGYLPSPETIQALAEWHVQIRSLVISQPVGPTALPTRQALSDMNIRGCYEFIVFKAKEVLQSTPHEHLFPELLHWFIHSSIRTCNNVAILKGAVKMGGFGKFLDPEMFAFPHYIPDGIAHATVPGWIVVQWQNYDPSSLEDVRFEATGPEIKVGNIARMTTRPDRADCPICLEEFPIFGNISDAFEVRCHHCFHFHCLIYLVNGVEKHSNKCPLCRTKICKARKRKPVTR